MTLAKPIYYNAATGPAYYSFGSYGALYDEPTGAQEFSFGAQALDGTHAVGLDSFTPNQERFMVGDLRSLWVTNNAEIANQGSFVIEQSNFGTFTVSDIGGLGTYFSLGFSMHRLLYNNADGASMTLQDGAAFVLSNQAQGITLDANTKPIELAARRTILAEAAPRLYFIDDTGANSPYLIPEVGPTGANSLDVRRASDDALHVMEARSFVACHDAVTGYALLGVYETANAVFGWAAYEGTKQAAHGSGWEIVWSTTTQAISGVYDVALGRPAAATFGVEVDSGGGSAQRLQVAEDVTDGDTALLISFRAAGVWGAPARVKRDAITGVLSI